MSTTRTTPAAPDVEHALSRLAEAREAAPDEATKYEARLLFTLMCYASAFDGTPASQDRIAVAREILTSHVAAANAFADAALDPAALAA